MGSRYPWQYVAELIPDFAVTKFIVTILPHARGRNEQSFYRVVVQLFPSPELWCFKSLWGTTPKYIFLPLWQSRLCPGLSGRRGFNNKTDIKPGQDSHGPSAKVTTTQLIQCASACYVGRLSIITYWEKRKKHVMRSNCCRDLVDICATYVIVDSIS